MLDSRTIISAIPHALDRFEIAGDIPRGKVRDFYITEDGKQRILITTDRMFVFNHQMGLVPFKGQILNELSAWWFEKTADILPNHYIGLPDPNVMVVRETNPFPVEVVVRSYITGTTPTSLWARYAAGERDIYGIKFPEGLHKNDALPEPVVTLTTKSSLAHDDRMPINRLDEHLHIPKQMWEKIQQSALALFKRGQFISAGAGLIMVDTKYEFGVDPVSGELLVIDELHTPDSGRFWLASSYEERKSAGQEPENMDREIVRLWYVSRNLSVAQTPPRIDEALIVDVSTKYQQVYEMLTGRTFEPGAYPAQDRIDAAIMEYA